MSLVPKKYFRDWWDDDLDRSIDRFNREVDEHWRRLDDDLWKPWWKPRWSFRDNKWYRSWHSFENLSYKVGGLSTVNRDDNKYEVIVNMQQFLPEEILVKTDGRYIIIEGKHEGKRYDYYRCNYLSKEFKRRYYLPLEYDINNVRTSLSSDGIVTITAPRLYSPGERRLPLTRTYRPAIKAV